MAKTIGTIGHVDHGKTSLAAVIGHLLYSEKPPVAAQQDWIQLAAYVDPPAPPAGYAVEVKRDGMLGIVYAYRFVPVT